MESSIEVDKNLLAQFRFLTGRKTNKIHVQPKSDFTMQTVSELCKKSGLEPPPKHEHKSSLSPQDSDKYEELLVLFFKVSYFLGITPYYPKVKVSETGARKVEVCSNKFHLVIVVAVHIITALRFLMRFSLLSYDLRQPINYFKIARTTLSASLCSFFIWSLWMRHKVFVLILNKLASFRYFPNITVISKKSVQYLILFIAIGLLCATSVNRALDECRMRMDTFCEHNQYGQSHFCHNATYYEEKTVFQISFTIFNYFGRTTRRLPRVELLVFGFTLWQLCKSFSKYLQNGSPRQYIEESNAYRSGEISEVLTVFAELTEISNLISQLIGEMLISEIVEDIIYFSLEVQLRLRDADWFSIFVIFESWMVAFLAYFVSACAAEHVEDMMIWLARDDVISQLSPGKLITLHNQLASNPIGLKGGSLFTLTKRFLANVVTVWLTYFIILLQFQASMSSK